MKQLSKILLVLMLAVVGFSCSNSSSTEEPSGPVDAAGRVIITGNITANRTLLAREKYILQGFVDRKSVV